MLKQLLTVSLSIFLFFLPLFLSAEQSATEARRVVITANSLITDNKENTATFEGAVVVESDNMTMYADKMVVRYGAEDGKIKRIDASNGVRVISGKKIIISRSAVYFSAEEKVVFDGDPKLMEDENIATGSKIVYFLNEDRSLIDDSRILLRKKPE